jgi:tetratricopeptide (TPR) repeat protein
MLALLLFCSLGPGAWGQGRREKADALFNAGIACYQKQDFAGAKEAWEKALPIYRELGLPRQEATTLDHLGWMSRHLSDYSRAASYYEHALRIWEQEKALDNQAQTLNNWGIVAVYLGEYGKALSGYKQALDVWRERGNSREEAASLNNLGVVEAYLGEYGKAVSYYKQALTIWQGLHLFKEHADLLNNLGVEATHLGEYAQAICYYEQALKIYASKALREDEADTLNNLGMAARNLGQYPQALRYYHQALKIYRDLPSQKGEAWTQCNIADGQLEQGEPAKALMLYMRFNAESIRRGRCYLVLGDPAHARDEFLKALQEARSSRNADVLVASLIGLGLVEERGGKPQSGHGYFQEAVEAIEDQRESVFPGERRQFLAGKVWGFQRLEAYEGLVRVLHQGGKSDEAFYWSEHTKARGFMEAMARAPFAAHLGLPWSWRRQEQNLLNRIAAAKQRLEEAFQKGNKELVSGLQRELKGLKQEQEELMTRLRREYPEYASMQYPQPLKASELGLHSVEVLIEFEVTEWETLVFVVRGGRVVKVYRARLTRRELQQKVERFRRCMATIAGSGGRAGWSELDVALAHSLYRCLLELALKEVKPPEKVLLVPDEVLCLLPFEALVEAVPGGEPQWAGSETEKGLYPQGVRYVGDNRVVSYWQSGSALTVTRYLRKAVGGGRMLVVADPIYHERDERLATGANTHWQPEGKLMAMALRGEEASGLRRVVTEESSAVKDYLVWDRVPRLPDTGEFAKRLRERYQASVKPLAGVEACESRLLVEPMEGYGWAVLYALHGIVDERTPYLQQAALLLSNPLVIGEPLKVKVGEEGPEREIDGYWTMSEVMEQKMLTELVGALACHTGEGGVVAGEGVMNLGRAFQYAGARSVLVSLWGVAGESTNLLTEWTLEGMRAGQPKDQALLGARKRLRRAGYEHPFYWAPFILIGERDVVQAQRKYLWIWIVGGAGGVVLLLVLLIAARWRKR